MGWETGVTSLMSAYQNYQKTNQAEDTANAQVQEGEYKASNIADNTLRTAGKLQTSFLQGGISLDGGPNAVIQQAFAKGTTDINRTLTNANNQSASTINGARTAALSMLSQTFMGSTGGAAGDSQGVSSGLSQLNSSVAYGLNDAGYGNTAYDMLDNSDRDPSPMPTWTGNN